MSVLIVDTRYLRLVNSGVNKLNAYRLREHFISDYQCDTFYALMSVKSPSQAVNYWEKKGFKTCLISAATPREFCELLDGLLYIDRSQTVCTVGPDALKLAGENTFSRFAHFDYKLLEAMQWENS